MDARYIYCIGAKGLVIDRARTCIRRIIAKATEERERATTL